MVQTSQWNEFPTYELTGVLVKEMAQEMTASAQAMSDAIARSGRLDVYGITFATRDDHRDSVIGTCSSACQLRVQPLHRKVMVLTSPLYFTEYRRPSWTQ